MLYDGKRFMEQDQELILDVWREASRHTEIATSTPNIAQLLRRWLPLERLIVRRIEPERACIETVGAGPAGALPQPLADRHDCDSASLQDLLAWCRRGEVVCWQRAGQGTPALAAVVPTELDGEFLIGPLVSEHGTCGVALVRAAYPQHFTPGHQRLLQALLEPLAVALHKYRPLRGPIALPEAARADKKSLLRPPRTA